VPVNNVRKRNEMTHIKRRKVIVPSRKIHLDESLYRKPGYVYFFTIRSNFGKAYFTNHDFNREIIDCLEVEKERLSCKVFVYCLRPTHLHFLTGTTCEEISVLDLVNQYKGKSTRIGWRYGIGKVLWQKRNYDHIVRRNESLTEIAVYILDNPVRKGLVEHREDYPYSGYWEELPVW
jgi:putative transposase